MGKVNFFWFRRDLRLEDNKGLGVALASGLPVQPVFIFDTTILSKLEDKNDARVEFIHLALRELHKSLKTYGSNLLVRIGKPEEVWQMLSMEFEVHSVYTNHDYEPYATARDRTINELLAKKGIYFQTYKDQVVFEKLEVVKDDGTPYTVFTPYSRKWKALYSQSNVEVQPVNVLHKERFCKSEEKEFPSLEQLGFQSTDMVFPSSGWEPEVIDAYSRQRDFPALHGTSRLGVHLRFGTIGIRRLVAEAGKINETFLNELIWREFYQMILWSFPQVGAGKSFKPQYDFIKWRNDEGEFEKWCTGLTGYPIVDAGMRELNATGYMHNRVRMIVASFLTKHLLIDWRWGESYFASKLLDFDLAANNGGWQWAAGSGCDAAPYFRVFNPTLQTQKFDSNLQYIRKWVPEIDGFDYPKPIVVHEFARKRCLEVYAAALGKG